MARATLFFLFVFVSFLAAAFCAFNIVGMNKLLDLVNTYYRDNEEAIDRATIINNRNSSASDDTLYIPRFGHTSSTLLEIFHNTTIENVKWNNWNMGCNDLAVAASYYRAIADRLYKNPSKRNGKLLIFDVGANDGQDAANVFGAFHKIQGMCSGISNVPYLLLAVEPSPKVFCDLYDAAVKQNWNDRYKNIYRILNIALSDNTGYLKFRDPGHEGGTLINDASSFSRLETMNKTEFERLQQCQQIARVVKKDNTTAGERGKIPIPVATVPTYTMDLLMTSLQDLRVVSNVDKIFILKIDTEGHDAQVIKGAASLLDQKQIVFVLFEVWTNSKIKEVAEFMSTKGYLCFVFTPKQLVPVNGAKWWYEHMDNFTRQWWGNGVCGIHGSESLAMFWRMYHSDDVDMMNSFEFL